MSFRVDPDPSFRDALEASDRSLAGIWVCSGSPLVAEICAGAGFDWLFIDAEHSPNGLESVLAQLQAVRGYPVVPVVRPAVNDVVLIKQFLDLGVQSLIVPMVNTAQDAAAAVSAVNYPPLGVRGVGSALARSARWNRIPNYLTRASESITLIVQIESAEAVANVEAIVATEGVHGIFIGPSDLAASMGVIGEQDHPEVVAAVEKSIAAAKAAGIHVGVNAFAEGPARRYIELGADFVGVGADVALLARGSESLAAKFVPTETAMPGKPASY
ncbi:aldolase/citrate lyase family protein [Paeniglutamicibacter cryotolerans]|uniref:4-hydroxy-2-oxoheptanedioate aldolase n=1 Tax=Paeniglutamicibacter cryotolerans TaxID=670079 RepID=A0A839QI00_9MICC|nr:aldolase/citrate lyase family protein [Paeniglutamicibacter cryotolerans]MBB2995809.1 4-hydroxy-2-oxoheptanedioate aldolase [Paeniglutamicibacter cryotolerans]